MNFNNSNNGDRKPYKSYKGNGKERSYQQQPQSDELAALKLEYGLFICKFMKVQFQSTSLNTMPMQDQPTWVISVMGSLEPKREKILSLLPHLATPQGGKYMLLPYYFGLKFVSDGDETGHVYNCEGTKRVISCWCDTFKKMTVLVEQVEMYFRRRRIIDMIKMDESDILDKAIAEFERKKEEEEKQLVLGKRMKPADFDDLDDLKLQDEIEIQSQEVINQFVERSNIEAAKIQENSALVQEYQIVQVLKAKPLE